MSSQKARPVQQTNDDSIISKRSASRFGYIDDDFLRPFASKPPRRSALINRGYYIRLKYVRDTMVEFLAKTLATEGRQIVSLGAGFDTSYWFLKKNGFLSEHDKYFEVDFSELVHRKKDIIQSSEELATLLGKPLRSEEDTQNEQSRLTTELTQLKKAYEMLKKEHADHLELLTKKEEIKKCEKALDVIIKEIHTDDYALIQGDLKQLSQLETKFRESGIDFKKPTLVLTECVLNYIPPIESHALILWVGRIFEHVIFFTYDQIKPRDAFGNVMCSTLKKRNSPLLGIDDSPSAKRIQSNFLSLDYDQSYSVDVLQCYNKGLTEEERSRVERLEEFDEHEEWLIKCQHYAFTISEKGLKDSFDHIKRIYPEKENKPEALPTHPTFLSDSKWFEHEGSSPKPLKLNRWGHAIIGHKNDSFITYGGFIGDSQKESVLQLIQVNDLKVESIKVMGSIPQQHRKFHTMTIIEQDNETTDAIIFGGRGGPRAPLNTFIKLKAIHDTLSFENLEVSGELPLPRWRHTTTKVESVSGPSLIIFGGRTTSATQNVFSPLNDVHIVDIHTWTSRKVEAKGDIPPARFSHTAVAYDNGSKLLVFGGTNGTEIYSDVHIFDVKTESWTEVTCKNEPQAVFSHSVVVKEHEGSPFMVSVGGCNLFGVSKFNVLDIYNLAWYTIEPETSLEKKDTLMAKHHALTIQDNIYILGGGALCFSFGTFYNPVTVLGKPQDVSTNIKENVEKQSDIISNIDPSPTSQVESPSISRSLENNQKIPLQVFNSVTLKQLKEEILPKRVPVVIKNLDIGTCKDLWRSKDYLKSKCQKKVSTRKCPERRLDFINKNFHFETMDFAYFIDKVFDPEVTDRYYFRSVGENPRKERSDFWASFPEFKDDFIIPEPFKSCIENRVFSSAFRISSTDSQLWTHYDVCDNILCHIVGRKEVVLWRPEDADNLYIDDSSSLVLDIDHPDLNKFPKFANAQPYVTILEPGDTLYIPALWLHNVVSFEPSISINIFWKDLDDSYYHSKDLYGNRMLVPVEGAFKKAEEIEKIFQGIPEPYRSFYSRELIKHLQESLLSSK